MESGLQHRKQEWQLVSPAHPAVPWGQNGCRVKGLRQQGGSSEEEQEHCLSCVPCLCCISTEGTTGEARDCGTQAKPHFYPELSLNSHGATESHREAVMAAGLGEGTLPLHRVFNSTEQLLWQRALTQAPTKHSRSHK